MEFIWLSMKVLDETDDSFITLKVEKRPEPRYRYKEGSIIRTAHGSLAVVLGLAATQEEVQERATAYFRRLCRWDKVPHASQVELGLVDHQNITHDSVDPDENNKELRTEQDGGSLTPNCSSSIAEGDSDEEMEHFSQYSQNPDLY